VSAAAAALAPAVDGCISALPRAPGAVELVLVFLDGSRGAERALPVALEVGRHRRAEILLLRVLDRRALSECADPWSVPGGASYLMGVRDALAPAAREAGCRVCITVRGGRPVPVILETARFRGADLIVLAAPGGCAPNARLGGVAYRVALAATVPVLVVGPRAGGTLVHQIGPNTDDSRSSARARDG